MIRGFFLKPSLIHLGIYICNDIFSAVLRSLSPSATSHLTSLELARFVWRETAELLPYHLPAIRKLQIVGTEGVFPCMNAFPHWEQLDFMCSSSDTSPLAGLRGFCATVSHVSFS
jgi:hypothetical protein